MLANLVNDVGGAQPGVMAEGVKQSHVSKKYSGERNVKQGASLNGRRLQKESRCSSLFIWRLATKQFVQRESHLRVKRHRFWACFSLLCVAP